MSTAYSEVEYACWDVI